MLLMDFSEHLIVYCIIITPSNHRPGPRSSDEASEEQAKDGEKRWSSGGCWDAVVKFCHLQREKPQQSAAGVSSLGTWLLLRSGQVRASPPSPGRMRAQSPDMDGDIGNIQVVDIISQSG